MLRESAGIRYYPEIRTETRESALFPKRGNRGEYKEEGERTVRCVLTPGSGCDTRAASFPARRLDPEAFGRLERDAALGHRPSPARGARKPTEREEMRRDLAE